MSGLLVIGIDTGPHTGIAWATFPAGLDRRRPALPWDVHALQCDNGALPVILPAIIALALCPEDVIIGTEKFITGNRAGSKGKNADVTRRGVEVAREIAASRGVRFVTASAAEAKTWGSAKRLEAIGLPAGLGRHARDGGRHLGFTACKHGGVPDPLIRYRVARTGPLAG